MSLASRSSLPVLALLGLVGIAACGDDAFTTSDGGGGAGTSSTGSTSSTTTSTASGVGGEGGAPGTGGAPATTGAGGAPGSGGDGGGGAPGTGGSGGTGGDGGAPGSGGGGTGGAPSCDDIPTTEIPGDACDAVAAAFCAQLEACAEPVFLIIAGTDAECLLLVAQDCRREQGLPGQDESADEVETCAETLVNASCECAGLACSESFGVGTLLDGAPCEVDGQCASGFCDEDGGDACGSCQALVAMGGSCADPDAECAEDLFCDDDETCQPYRAAGEACSDNDQCGPDDFGGDGARCVDDVCGPGIAPGASCLGNEEACAGFAICSPLSSTCEPLGIAGPEEACGFDLETGDIAICRGDLICSDQLGGTCLPRGVLDAECALDDGGEPTEPSDHDCLPHLACIEGTCQPIPDVVCE